MYRNNLLLINRLKSVFWLETAVKEWWRHKHLDLKLKFKKYMRRLFYHNVFNKDIKWLWSQQPNISITSLHTNAISLGKTQKTSPERKPLNKHYPDEYLRRPVDGPQEQKLLSESRCCSNKWTLVSPLVRH